MEYQFKSRNTLCYLSLHDCEIQYVEWIDTSLIFHFNWVNVLKIHPQNQTGKAKVARNAILIFENAIELSCIYYDLTRTFYNKKKANKREFFIPDDADVVTSSIIERCKNVEISKNEVFNENGINIWNCSCHNDSNFKMTYSNMYVCFNQLEENAWFEE